MHTTCSPGILPPAGEPSKGGTNLLLAALVVPTRLTERKEVTPPTARRG